MFSMPEWTVVDALLEFWFLCLAPLDRWRFIIDFIFEAAICLAGLCHRLCRKGRFNKYISLAAQLFHRRGQCFLCCLQDKGCALEQLTLRQKAVTLFVRCLRENMLKPRCQARHAVARQSKLHRNLIGSAKAYSIDVLCHFIGIFADHLDRSRAILLINACRQVHRHVIRLQEEVQFLDFALLGPGLYNLLAIPGAHTLDLVQALRLLLDDGKGLLAEVLHNEFRLLRSDTLYQARAKVAGNAFDGSWQALCKAPDVQLAAILGIAFPFTFNRQQLTNVDAGQGTNNGGQVIAKQPPIVIGAKACNGVMVVFVAKNDALNGAFECRHTELFHPGDARPEIPFHISTVMGRRRVCDVYIAPRATSRAHSTLLHHPCPYHTTASLPQHLFDVDDFNPRYVGEPRIYLVAFPSCLYNIL